MTEDIENIETDRLITVADRLYNKYFEFTVDANVVKKLGWNKDEQYAYAQAVVYLNERFKKYIRGVIIDHIKSRYPKLRPLTEEDELNMPKSQVIAYKLLYEERLAIHDENEIPKDFIEASYWDGKFDDDPKIHQKIVDEIKLHKVAAIASVFQPEISMEHHSFNKHLQKGKSYVGRPSDYAIIGNYKLTDKDYVFDKKLKIGQSGIKTDEFEEKIKRGDELRELSEKSEDALGTLRGFILEFVEEPQKHMFSRKRGWGTRTTTRGLASDMVRYCLINDIANNANSLYAWDKLDHVDDGSYTYQRRKYNKDGKLIKRRVYVRSRDDKSPKYGKTMGDTLYHDDENIMGITKAFEAYTNGLRHVMFDRLKQTTDVARSTAGGRIFKKTLHENIAAFSITGITSTFVGSLVTFGVVSGAAVTVGIAMLSGGVAGVIVAGIAALGFYFHRRNRRKKEAKYGEFEKKYSEALNGVEVDLNNMKSTDKKKQKIGVFGVEEKITNIVLEKADLQSKTQGRLVEEPYMRLDIKDRPELQFDITETLKKFI